MQGNQHWQSCSPMLLVTGHLPLTSQLIGWRASVITKLNNGNFTAPSRDVIFLHLEFGLKFTKGNKFVYQKNIQIPAALELPLRVTASHLHHHCNSCSLSSLLISSRNCNSLSCLFSSISSNLWRVPENSKKKLDTARV